MSPSRSCVTESSSNASIMSEGWRAWLPAIGTGDRAFLLPAPDRRRGRQTQPDLASAGNVPRRPVSLRHRDHRDFPSPRERPLPAAPDARGACLEAQLRFHRHVSGKGAGFIAGTILQVPGHHYLGLDLARDEEIRLRGAIMRAGGAEGGSPNGTKDPAASRELRRLLRFWARYGFEAIRTHPKGSAPHTGGRPISWLPLDPQLAMPIRS